MNNSGLADEEKSVSAIYQDKLIADSYLEKRLQFSWQRLLHEKQVAAVNNAIRSYLPKNILELAPGPARLAVELYRVKQGIMIENSEQMVSIALERLAKSGLDRVWKVINGSAFELDEIIPNQSFDFVYTFRFVRHYREIDRIKLYESVKSRLVTNGIFIFDVVNEILRDKIESRNREKPSDEISIYDATYTIQTFQEEMKQNGFDIISLEPLIRHFGLQSWLSYKFDDVFSKAIPKLIYWLEKLPSRQPLEWIVVCQKK